MTHLALKIKVINIEREMKKYREKFVKIEVVGMVAMIGVILQKLVGER